MSSNHSIHPVGVIGSGSFGTTVAMLLSENVDVLLYTRRKTLAETINNTHTHLNRQLPQRIVATNDIEALTEQCRLIFPIVPSTNFRDMIRTFSPHLRPHHLLIHGTKGFDNQPYKRKYLGKHNLQISTMSEVIRQESNVVRVGCLSGPNLAEEILQGQPAATVIASPFREVIQIGKKSLRSSRFQVFSNYDIIGAELAGALKNIIAVGSGVLGGLGLGHNIWALLVTRGLSEMINFGKALGADIKPFLGIAGIGDLIATASSKKSRNYTVGYRIAKGETLDEIMKTMVEPAEGVRTIQFIYEMVQKGQVSAPITTTIYKILFEGLEVERAINFLMNYRYSVDVDYL